MSISGLLDIPKGVQYDVHWISYGGVFESIMSYHVMVISLITHGCDHYNDDDYHDEYDVEQVAISVEQCGLHQRIALQALLSIGHQQSADFFADIDADYVDNIV